jgi:hypothetical protein
MPKPHDLIPPATVRVVAQRGLNLYEKSGGAGCEEQQLAKAIVSEEALTPQQVDSLSEFFDRGASWRKNIRQRGSSDYCKWLMLGGMLGMGWVQKLKRGESAKKGRLQKVVRSHKKDVRKRFSDIVSRVSSRS